MLNYLFFCPSPSFGGLEMVTALKAAQAAGRGNRSVLAASEGSPLWDYGEKLGIELADIDIKADYVDIASAAKLGMLMKRTRTDICIVPKTKFLSIAILARKVFSQDTKIILHQHMQSGLNKKDWFHNWIYKEIDGAIVLNGMMKNQIVETTIISADKIAVVPNSIDTTLYSPERFNKREMKEKFDFPPDAFVAGYAARFDEQKDQETAVLAFTQNLPEDCYLLLAGDDSLEKKGYKKFIGKLIRDKHLEYRIKLIPFTKEMPEFMNALDVFLIPSLSETFGVVIIEAMAAGCPVIGVNSGGVPELVKHGVTGYLIEQKEYIKMSEYIKLLYSDKALREKLCSNALSESKNYDDSIILDKYFNFCESLVD